MFAGNSSVREESSEDDLEDQEEEDRSYEGHRLSTGSEPLERLAQNARAEHQASFNNSI